LGQQAHAKNVRKDSLELMGMSVFRVQTTLNALKIVISLNLALTALQGILTWQVIFV